MFRGRGTGFDTRTQAMIFPDDARAVAFSEDGVYLAGSDEEGPLEADSDDDWGADPVKAFEASRRRRASSRSFKRCCWVSRR